MWFVTKVARLILSGLLDGLLDMKLKECHHVGHPVLAEQMGLKVSFLSCFQ